MSLRRPMKRQMSQPAKSSDGDGEDVQMRLRASLEAQERENVRPKVRETEEQEKKNEAMEKGLEAIYAGEGGKIPDLTILERRPRRLWLRITGLFVAAAVLFITFAWMGKQWMPTLPWQREHGLRISVTGPKTIALGKEERFEIQWRNEADVSLERAAIRLGLPVDFIPTGFEPALSDRTRISWDMGQPFSNASGTLAVKGIFIGSLGSRQAIQAIGESLRKGSGRGEEWVTTFAVSYDRSLIIGELDAPANVLAGDPVTLRYAVRNQTDRAVEGLLARVIYPAGFVPRMASSTPWSRGMADVAMRELTMTLPRLPAQTTTTVDLAGFFSSGISGDQTFFAESGRRGVDAKFQTMNRSELRVPVSAGDLAIHLIVNGAQGDRSFPTGDPLRITIAYQNTGSETLKNVELLLGLESILDDVSATGTSLLAWNRMEDAVGGTTNTRLRVQTVRYDKKQVPAFAALEPRTEGALDVFLPTLALATGTHDAAIRIALEGFMDGSRGKIAPRRAVSASGVLLHYRTDADVAVEARYFTEEGAPLGFGPLPPVAGKTTSYRIYWRLWKTLHPLEQVEVSAVLPKIVAWGARSDASAGTIAYDEASRTVRWAIDRVADGEQDLEASFEVQLVPEQVDIGRFASLLGETRIVMKDPLVHETISRKRASLTTDLDHDEGARRKGVVKRE